MSNDDWITNREEVEETGIPPTHDLESAIVAVLSPALIRLSCVDKTMASVSALLRFTI